MSEKSPLSTMHIVNAYEHTKSTSTQFFNALRESRKFGFRMCQYKFDDTVSKEINAVIFCLSLCHRENILLKASVDNAEFRTALQEAISKSQTLKNDVDFLLSYSPEIDWNGGG
jgi:pyruvate-formate lyase